MIQEKTNRSFESNNGGNVKRHLNTFPNSFLVQHEQQGRNGSVFTRRKKKQNSSGGFSQLLNKLYGQSLLAMMATFLGEMVGSKMGRIVTSMESPCSWRNISLSSKISVSSTGPSAARIDQYGPINPCIFLDKHPINAYERILRQKRERVEEQQATVNASASFHVALRSRS